MNMHRLIPIAATAAVSLVLVGCAERVNAPTALRPPAVPRFEILDGAHNGGNPHFYFKPPIVASPTRPAASTRRKLPA